MNELLNASSKLRFKNINYILSWSKCNEGYTIKMAVIVGRNYGWDLSMHNYDKLEYLLEI